MLARCLVLACSLTPALGVVAAGKTRGGWGTETVFLMKGGYGVSTSLVSGTPKTTRTHAVAKPAAPPQRADAVGEDILRAAQTASTLTQQLQAAVHQAVVSDDAQRAEKKLDAQLKSQVAADQQKMRVGEQAAKDNVHLRQQIARLTADLSAAKTRAAKAEGELHAYAAKDKDLESELIVSNKAWREAAIEETEQAVKAASAQKAAKKAPRKQQTPATPPQQQRAPKSDVPLPAKRLRAAARKAAPAPPRPVAARRPAPSAVAEQAAEDEVEDEDAGDESGAGDQDSAVDDVAQADAADDSTDADAASTDADAAGADDTSSDADSAADATDADADGDDSQ